MQDSGFFGVSRERPSDSDRKKIPSESLGSSRETPKEHVVRGSGMQDSCFFDLSCKMPSDSSRKRARSESLGSLQERPKKQIVHGCRSFSELNVQALVGPTEAAAVCTTAELTRHLPDTPPPVPYQKSQQSHERAYDPRRFAQPQSWDASDEIGDSVFNEDRCMHYGREHDLVHSGVVAPSSITEIRSSSNPSGIITSISEDDLRIGLRTEPSSTGEVEPYFSIGPKSQAVASEVFQASEVDTQMSKHELQRVKMETSPEAAGERCTILGLQDWTQREREIHSLSKEAHELGQKQQESVRISQRLEQRIKQGELAYGEMLRRSLELHRALEKRRQHIYEDKSTLEKEVISAKSMGDRINAIMAEIMSITKTDASSVKSET